MYNNNNVQNVMDDDNNKMKIDAEKKSAFANPALHRKKLYARASLLICNSCLWCASALDTVAHIIDRCPACGEPAAASVEAIPISSNEAYRIKKKAGSSGIELDFTLAA